MKKTGIKILGIYIIFGTIVAMYLLNLNKEDKPIQTISHKSSSEINKSFASTLDEEEEEKRVKLYISVLKDVFKIENGGNGFIALKGETLEGLKEEKSKEEVLEGLKSLSPNLYWYEEVKDNKAYFEFDENGRMAGTKNGTVLYLKVVEFKDNKAIIEATSWFGNLGAVFPKYKAVYENGEWQLKTISMAIS